MNYLTIELKTNNEGGTGADLLYSGSDRMVAESKYHAALATAATSGRPCHACVIVQSDGTLLDSYGYLREWPKQASDTESEA